MARTEGDSWDLASSVGATATMVAAARAAATRRPQPVITDQFAEPLVRAVGLDVFTKLASGELDSDDVERGIGFPRMTDIFAARARYYDEYFADATAAGVQQVVIVASGLDARPYRLPWPAGTSPLAAFGQPLGLHHQQRHHFQLRGVRVQLTVALVDVDDHALGVQPAGVLAEVDGVGGLRPRQALAVGGVDLFGDVHEIASDGSDSVRIGDRTVARYHDRRVQGDHRVAGRHPVGDRAGPHDRRAADEQ